VGHIFLKTEKRTHFSQVGCPVTRAATMRPKINVDMFRWQRYNYIVTTYNEVHYMPRHKLKPNFDSKATMREMITAMATYYGEPYYDRYDDIRDRISLRATAEHFNITILKVRKMLIGGADEKLDI